MAKTCSHEWVTSGRPVPGVGSAAAEWRQPVRCARPHCIAFNWLPCESPGERFTFHCHDTSVGIWREIAEPDWDTYEAVRMLLVSLGFSFHQQARVHRSIRKSYHEGRRGDLQFESSIHGRHIELVFFQDLIKVNPHGGQYDFDRLAKMPYLVRMVFLNVRRKLVALLNERGMTDDTERRPADAFAAVQWERDRTERTHRGIYALAWPSYNITDADGALIRDGDVRWFRDDRGHLQRAVVYRNLNNMPGWWAVLNRRKYTNRAASDLFTFRPGVHSLDRVHPRGRQRLESALAAAVAAEDFERAARIRDARNRRFPSLSPGNL